MMTRRIPVVVLALALLGAVPATAQTDQQELLKGLTAVQVAIGVSDDSTVCGVTETLLRTATSKALLDNGVAVDDFTANTTLYITVLARYIDAWGQCVSRIGVELFSFVFATPDHSEQQVYGRFMLADSSLMDTSGSAAHRQRIRDGVFKLVEALAVDIRLANQ